MIDLAYFHNSESHIWLNNTIYSHEKPLTKFLAKSLILQSKKLLFWQQICWVAEHDVKQLGKLFHELRPADKKQ